MKGLKTRLQKGEVLIGTFLSLGNAITTEIVANAGFDWVIIDLEHGMGAEGDVVYQLLGLKNTNVSAIVRVESYQRQRIHRVLDAGADGIMCPKIETATEAELAVKAILYPPAGIRGVAKMIRAADYGADFDGYSQRASGELLGVIQIETVEALDHLDAIAGTSGVDVLFIGPSDLTMALGIFGQTDHPLFVNAVRQIVAAAASAGKHAGILLSDAADLKRYKDMGIHFIACGTDAGFLNKGARQMVETLRKAIK
ncbi:MAG TPA: aldolase/citrate lyase family protein [Puia sp.]|jgi:4-hydroxy-2-oxoheptanedioate aldolase